MLSHESIKKVNRLMEQTGMEHYGFGQEPPSPVYRDIGHTSVEGAKYPIRLERVLDPETGDVVTRFVNETEEE